MIGASWLCVVMAAAGAASAPASPATVEKARPQLLVMDLDGAGVDAQDVVAATRIVTAAAAEVDGIDVLSAADLRKLAAMEADRQNALAVGAVIWGTLK